MSKQDAVRRSLLSKEGERRQQRLDRATTLLKEAEVLASHEDEAARLAATARARARADADARQHRMREAMQARALHQQAARAVRLGSRGGKAEQARRSRDQARAAVQSAREERQAAAEAVRARRELALRATRAGAAAYRQQVDLAKSAAKQE